MQKISSLYLPIIMGLLIAASNLSCVQARPDSDTVQPAPVLESVRDTVKSSSTLPEFEGRYQVGDTTCTVTPVKMAFEIRWAKGRGVMHFFFDRILPDGKAVFVSKDYGKGRDQFVFDDNLYNSGKFLRADGRGFTVIRLSDQIKE